MNHCIQRRTVKPWNRLPSRPVLTLMTFLATPLAGIAAPAAAQEAPSGESDRLTTLVVVGNRAAPRSTLDSTAPVDVFSAADLQQPGAMGNELGEALSVVAPSFSFPRQSNSVTSDHIRAARLRNLSPDQTLVLVNGKRRHPGAVVNDNTTFGKGSNAFDFNTIPLSAVERVEILRDGASAQYGSDAIAGVINIILKDGAEGGSVSAGGGQHVSDFPVTGETVTDGQTAFVTAQQGMALGTEGFLRAGAELRSRRTTNRAGLNRVPAFVAPQTRDNLAFAGQQTSRSGDPDSQELRLWGNAAWQWGGAEGYGHITLLEQDTEGAVLFRHPDSNQNVKALYPEGTLPVSTGENRDVAGTAGLRFALGDWALDGSVSYGRNRFLFGVRDSLNASLGPDSPTRFDSGRFRFSQLNMQLDATRELRLAGRPVSLATGVALRHEDFRSRAGEPDSWRAGEYRYGGEVVLADGSTVDRAGLLGAPDIGAQGAKGLTPEDATSLDRLVTSLYGEMSSQLTDTLYASAALRWEDYDDFGDAVTGKLAAIWSLTPRWSLRGSVSNSFRAPTLSQLAWSRSDNTFDAETFERIASRLIRADSAIGRALSLPSLDKEDADSVSIGVTARPTDSLQFTADLFRIDIDDRITVSESLQGQALIDRVQTLPGGTGVQSVNFFTNAIDTRTEGIELVADWRTRLAGGELGMNLSWSHIETDIRSLREAPAALRAIDDGVQLFEAEAINVLTTASPENLGVFTGTWRRGGWEALVRTRYYGSVYRDRGFAAQTFGADTLVDLSLQYRINAQWSVTAGADNVFDQLSEPSGPSLDFGGNFAYEVLPPAGANGRFLHLRIDYEY